MIWIRGTAQEHEQQTHDAGPSNVHATGLVAEVAPPWQLGAAHQLHKFLRQASSALSCRRIALAALLPTLGCRPERASSRDKLNLEGWTRHGPWWAMLATTISAGEQQPAPELGKVGDPHGRQHRRMTRQPGATAVAHQCWPSAARWAPLLLWAAPCGSPWHAALCWSARPA
jgi:hypothetical protein